MTRLVVLIGMLLSFFLGLTNAQDCPENEVLDRTCGRECIPTCYGMPEICQCSKRPSDIGTECNICICKEGYIRDQPGGKCVLIEECPKIVQCPENEEFSEKKPDCEPSCQNKENEATQYTPGCVCEKGYIREGPGGRCVPESCENVTICKENEIWSRCKSCPIYCNKSEISICPRIRLICRPGCDCAPGYIRKSRSDPTCIPTSECPCNENEVYNECGSPCPPTCSQQNSTCDEWCDRGCFCRDGYILDDTKEKCVEISECPKKKK